MISFVEVHKMRHLVSYYWTFTKHLGFRVWETRGRELISALVLSVVTFFVSRIFRQLDSVAALEIAVLALAGWLCIFALGHLIHTPVLLQEGDYCSNAHLRHWGFGVLGVVILIVIGSAITSLGMLWWVERTPKITIPSADPGALRPIIEAQKRQIADLQARVPDERNLKLRALEAANEFEQFWRKQPKAPTCSTTAGMTQQQIQDALKPCNDYYNKQAMLYQQVLAPRIMAIVAEFKTKGANVLNIEACAAVGLCGIPLVVQLKALAEQLDAHDNLKGSGCSS